MGSLSALEQRKLAYFHSLGKAMTENTQAVYETKYKSSHNVRLNEVWSDDITYVNNYTSALAESITNDAVTIFEEVELDMIYGSNGQAYAYISGGTFKDNSFPIIERGQVTSGGVFIRPWISPVDIPNVITNEPSIGYQLRLFRGSDATSGIPNSEIYLTEGAWSVDYYTGIIHFAEDYTPIDLGWGTIKATFFQYSGNYGASTGATNSDAYSSVQFNSGTSQLTFNSGETTETSVDLSSLKNENAYISAVYNITTNTIIFNSGGTNQTSIDLSSLKTTSGTTSSISPNNINMTALNTSSVSPLACSTGISSGNVSNSMVAVFVNGVQVNVGDSVNDDCYFSDDGGSTKRTPGDENSGDLLYWNYDGTTPVIGYELTTNDSLTFLHLTV